MLPFLLMQHPYFKCIRKLMICLQLFDLLCLIFQDTKKLLLKPNGMKDMDWADPKYAQPFVVK